jgi:hypothetical protein
VAHLAVLGRLDLHDHLHDLALDVGLAGLDAVAVLGEDDQRLRLSTGVSNRARCKGRA